MKVVVFCPNLIGDTVMATPTLRALRKTFAAARIDAVIRPSIAPTLDGNPWLDELIRFDPRSNDRSFRTAPLLRWLRSARYDLAVLLPNSFRAAWIARGGRLSPTRGIRAGWARMASQRPARHAP